MNKNTFWGVAIGMVVIEVVVLFALVWPAWSSKCAFIKEVDSKIDDLGEYRTGVIPVADIAARHNANANNIRNGYFKLLDMLKDYELKRYEKWMGRDGTPKQEVRPAQFNSYYSDQMQKLAEFLKKSGVPAPATPGEYTREENELLRDWGQNYDMPTPGATEQDETVPPSDRERAGLWWVPSASLTPANSKRAQKEYWVQETIAHALVHAGATRLTQIAFRYPSLQRRRGVRRKEEPTKISEIERLFEPIEVYVLAKMYYGRIPAFLQYMLSPENEKNHLLLRLEHLEVRKALIEKLELPDKRARDRIRAAGKAEVVGTKKFVVEQPDIKGVFPPILLREPDMPFDLKTLTPEKISKMMLKQDELISEPAVIVAAKFVVLDFRWSPEAEKGGTDVITKTREAASPKRRPGKRP